MLSPNDISFRIQHVANLLLRESDQVLQEQLGIGMAQFRILHLLYRGNHLLQQQIAEALNQTEASISRQVKLLKQQQLLAIDPSPKDRREHLTVLTPKGVRLTATALDVLQTYQASLICDLSEKQRIELMDLLAKIRRSIKGDL